MMGVAVVYVIELGKLKEAASWQIVGDCVSFLLPSASVSFPLLLRPSASQSYVEGRVLLPRMPFLQDATVINNHEWKDGNKTIK